MCKNWRRKTHVVSGIKTRKKISTHTHKKNNWPHHKYNSVGKKILQIQENKICGYSKRRVDI